MVLIRGLAKDPALRYPSVKDLNDAFQEALAIALDPQRRAASMASTANLDRTAVMYRKYQNVKPPVRRRWYERSALLVALLLLLACSVSAGVLAVAYPEIFGSGGVASAMRPEDIQGTVDVLLTANAPVIGTDLPPGALETAVYYAVLQTLAATEGIALPTDDRATIDPFLSPTPTTGILFPTPTPTRTRTLRPGETPPTPTRTPTPSRTPTTGPTPTGAPTATASDVPTATSAPTSTPAPTNTPQPPSPTATWKSTCGPNISNGHCNQTQSAATKTAEAAAWTPTP
jgi:hypothetical protein